MPENTHIESIAEVESQPEAVSEPSSPDTLRAEGAHFASRLGWLPGTTQSSTFLERSRKVSAALGRIFASVEEKSRQSATEDLRWLRDNFTLIFSEIASVITEVKPYRTLPHIRTPKGKIVPRAFALAKYFLDSAGYQFTDQAFASFCQGFQENAVLNLRELWAIAPSLKLALLEQIATRGSKAVDAPAGESHNVGVCVRSLREVTQAPWKVVLEPLILFDQVLREDPDGAYPEMDFESRSLYRDELAKIARRSDCTETEVAREALTLAQQAHAKTYRDPRVRTRESHVGYYIVAEGRSLLCQKVGCKPDFVQNLRGLLRQYPDEFFLPGIAILTFAIITGVLLWLTPPTTSPVLVLLSMLMLLFPSSQSAVLLMNYLVTALLPAQILPKLDFSDRVPNDCTTLVAVPTLLLNEKQVRGLLEDLEARFLGNHDLNIHFPLLSDLPDSDQPASEDNPLIDLCAGLIRELNEKYAGQEMGSFFLLHRHRVYNPREKGWMGWERKRGKLLDLNKLLRGQYDSFPIKEGDLSILPTVRYVITLDSDTELPRGAAHRMVGTLAHPLNQAIIDPVKNIVVAGYGILQPRVGVSVQSTANSRLAAIYAGETGFDIYTRAVSDAYQDLYGEDRKSTR